MAWPPDAPQRPTLRNKIALRAESDTAGCLRSYLPPSAAGLKPAERGPGGGLTATYCTQRGMMKNSTPHTGNAHFYEEDWASWGPLGSLLAPLGGLLGPLGSLLVASWGPLGGLLRTSWGFLGANIELRGQNGLGNLFSGSIWGGFLVPKRA